MRFAPIACLSNHIGDTVFSWLLLAEVTSTTVLVGKPSECGWSR